MSEMKNFRKFVYWFFKPANDTEAILHVFASLAVMMVFACFLIGYKVGVFVFAIATFLLMMLVAIGWMIHLKKENAKKHLQQAINQEDE